LIQSFHDEVGGDGTDHGYPTDLEQAHHQPWNQIAARCSKGRSADYIQWTPGLHPQHCRDIVVKPEAEQASDEQSPKADADVSVANGRLCKLQVEANPKKDPGVGGKGALVPRHSAAEMDGNGPTNVLGNDMLHGTPSHLATCPCLLIF
jgi:hypothetical protein